MKELIALVESKFGLICKTTVCVACCIAGAVAAACGSNEWPMAVIAAGAIYYFC